MNRNKIFNLIGVTYAGMLALSPLISSAASLKVGGGIQTDFAWFEDDVAHPLRKLGYGANNLSFDNQSNVTAAEMTMRGSLVKNFVYNVTVNHNFIERYQRQRQTVTDPDLGVKNYNLIVPARKNLLVRDAWVGWDAMDPWVRLSLGRMNVQQGLENAADHSTYTFIAPAAGQRSFMVGRANGITFEGNPFAWLGYQAGGYYYTTNAGAPGGVPGTGVNIDESSQVVVTNIGNNRTMYSGRAFLQPLTIPGKVLHLGASYSHVNTTGDVTLSAAPGGYFNLSNSKLIGLSTASGSPVARDPGNFKRTNGYNLWGVEALGILGPWHLQAEYHDYKIDLTGLAATAGNRFSVPRDNAETTTSSIKASGYYVQGSWLLTGETRHYDPVSGTLGKVKPIRKYGAWEVAGRFDKVDFAKTVNVTGNTGRPVIFCGDYYRSFAGDNVTSCNNGGEMTDWTAGLNWYPNSNVKLMANYTWAEGKYAKAADMEGPEFGNVTAGVPSSRHANRKVNILVVKGQVSF